MKLIVLDYSDGNVHIIKDVPEDVESLVNDMFKESDISWMLTEDDCRYFTWTYDKKSNTAKYDNENFIVND